jgi:hypothetical protein
VTVSVMSANMSRSVCWSEGDRRDMKSRLSHGGEYGE